MRLDASYNLCSKLGSKLIFCGRNYGNFSFARPFLDFVCIFLSDLFLKVGPDKIYARETDPAEEQAVELAGHLGVVPAEVDCAWPRRA